MSTVTTNIYPILNLNELAARYRVYKIRGLSPEHPEYFQNRQALTKRMSFALRTPALVIDTSDQTQLIVREDAPEPESPYQLIRTTVCFDRSDEVRNIDFLDTSSSSRAIAVRFLQFMLQAPLSTNVNLWQPGAGKPFFEKCGENFSPSITRYTGFSVRVVPIPNGGLGLCVDATHKYVNSQPLPEHLTRNEFRDCRGRTVVYHFGHKWYEIQLREFLDMTVSEYKVTDDGKEYNLIDYICAKAQKPIPQELAQLDADASAVLYRTNVGEMRAVPAPLCYIVLDSSSVSHQSSCQRLLPPEARLRSTENFVSKYLRSLGFAGMTLRISHEPMSAPRKAFLMPDFEFGNGVVLSVRGTQGSRASSLHHIGRDRALLLRDKGAGFYSRDPLSRQYLILPATVRDTFGPRFISDLRRSVDDIFPQQSGYDPILIYYNDRVKRNFVDQAKSILEAARADCKKPGYAVVMVHRLDGRAGQHDELAAMVTRKLRELDVCSAVIHSDVGRQSYRMTPTRNGGFEYTPDPNKSNRLSGYLRNVALNKVLLTNERWPFVLKTPLHADVAVGIDVKHNTAGFTVVSGRGHLVRTVIKTSNQKEKLLAQQVRTMLFDVVASESRATASVFESIMIQRDGILWESERLGICRALKDLVAEGALRPDSQYAILEIPKTAPAPVRLYEKNSHAARLQVENPTVGTYLTLDDANAYVCATGLPFSRFGTVRPLHIKRTEGTLSLIGCLEDVFYLTCLAWTRPEDCTRDPITIKLTDRRLGEDASRFDDDALEYSSIDTEEAEVL